MNQILHCDWLPERASWSYLTHLLLPQCPEFTDLDSISVHKHAKKELRLTTCSITHTYRLQPFNDCSVHVLFNIPLLGRVLGLIIQSFLV